VTLQRRLLLLLAGVPLLWLAALAYSVTSTRQEVDELFDTQLVRLAQQVAALQPAGDRGPMQLAEPASGQLGAAELDDLSVAIWRAAGTPLLLARAGVGLPFDAGARGFVVAHLNGAPWRVYYLPSADGTRLIAVGQSAHERDEVLRDALASQLLPWLLTLPLLLVVIAGAVRHALAPLRALARELETRRADDLRPVAHTDAPQELAPLVTALNLLFARIAHAIEHERRLTADAAHELRTPLAALRAHWEAAQIAAGDAARERALARVGEGIDRLAHLVAQLLALAGVEGADTTARKQPVDWPRVVGNALSDCLPLMEAKASEVEVHWPPQGAPLPLLGDELLLATLLRNLIDNALRYSPARTHVHVRFTPQSIVVEDEGPGIAPQEMPRLGDRFYRPAGQTEGGSGLGISIVKRIAALHDLRVIFENRVAGERIAGLRVTVCSADGLAVAPAQVEGDTLGVP
jgi:two-component system sensor histidine kinase QseC